MNQKIGTRTLIFTAVNRDSKLFFFYSKFTFTSCACLDFRLELIIVCDNPCENRYCYHPSLKWFQLYNSLEAICFLEGTCKSCTKLRFSGGRTRFPKFKFSANFPIGFPVILQIQIKKRKKKRKKKKCLISYVKKYFDRKSVGVQPWTPLEVILNEFCFWIKLKYAVYNGRISGCCHIEFGSTYQLPPLKILTILRAHSILHQRVCL